MSCSVTKFLSNPHRQLDILYLLVGIGIFCLIARWFGKKRKIQKMYDFLKERVLSAADETLNVTHTMVDLET